MDSFCGTKKRFAPAKTQRRNVMFRGTTLLACAWQATLARNVRQSPENRYHSRASGRSQPVRAHTSRAALWSGLGTAFPFIVMMLDYSTFGGGCKAGNLLELQLRGSWFHRIISEYHSTYLYSPQ